MASIKARAERDGKVRRTIAHIEQTIAKLERMKVEYMQKAVEAKARDEVASYNLAKSGVNATLTQIKRAKEMLLNIRITAELQKMGETNADFLKGMSTIAKRISKINRQSDFVKLQKEINKALSGMEEAQVGLDGFLQNSEAAFATISSAPGALSDSELDSLIEGKVTEKQLLMDEQIEMLIRGIDGGVAENASRVEVGAPEERPADRPVKPSVALPFPSPKGYFDFSADGLIKSPVKAFSGGDVPCVVAGTREGGELIVPLDKTPHVVVGGDADGLIKSSIAAILSSDAALRTRLILISPTGRLIGLNNVKQMAADVITDSSDAVAAIKLVREEVDKRFDTLSAAGAADIEQYKLRGGDMPYAVVFIDLDLCPGAETEFIRLARQSGDVGIYTVARSNAISPSLAAVTNATASVSGGAVSYVCGEESASLGAPMVSADVFGAIISSLKGGVA